MHHNRSLLPDVEVLLGVMVKTSRCSTKLLFVVLNFYSWIFFIILTKFSNFKQISEFWPNFWISNKLQNINQISEFQPNFRISTKLWEFNQIPEFQTHFKLWNSCCKILIWLTLSWADISPKVVTFFWTLEAIFEQFLLRVTFNCFFSGQSCQQE